MPDLSREGPFDVHQDASESWASPRVLDNLPGCQYRMTSYDEHTAFICMIHGCWSMLVRLSRLDFSAVVRSIGYITWVERTLAAALQLQHDAGLILSNPQVLGQFITFLNRMSSEVMRVAFDREPFPTEAVQFVAPSHHVRRAAHYMAAMGLWRPPSTQGIIGPLPSSSCNTCMSCSDIFN